MTLDMDASPDAVTLTVQDMAGQSLARGAVATALLHLERAWSGSGDWETAQAHIHQVVARPIDAAAHAGLYYGAPAVAFLLHTAADRHSRYRRTAEALDQHVLRVARRRLATATDRMHRCEPATFAEYDLFYGLSGIGALLLRHHPNSDELARTLQHLVALVTQPLRQDGVELPGWWVAHDPDDILPTPGGHLNLGMAHGAAGLLAVLSLATLRGCVVDGQHEAIAVLSGWFDHWRQDGPHGPWWPLWITRDDLRTGRTTQAGPGRVSWCYGAVGLGRALQLAALATRDPQLQEATEDILAASLSDTQLDRITEPGLCHGLAGIYQTTYRAAREARSHRLAHRLPGLAARLTQQAGPPAEGADRTHPDGLLTGSAGIGLALETARYTRPPYTGWDACLLIT